MNRMYSGAGAGFALSMTPASAAGFAVYGAPGG